MNSPHRGALDGVRVVDFGQYVSGPLVAQMLADYGADVIRIDPPGGPVWDHESNAILQRGKRSIVLDLKATDDLAVARRLVDSADILIENFRPGVMARLGLGPAESLARNARLVFGSIPGFASDDERAGVYATEGVVAAAAGLYPPQDLDWENVAPTVNTLPLASTMGAFTAVNSIVAALIARETSGCGQHVEVSLYDAAYELTRTYIDEPPGGWHTPPHGYGGSQQYPLVRGYECSDGRWVRMTWLEGRQIQDFAQIVGKHAEWKALGYFDVGVQRMMADLEKVDVMTEAIGAVFRTQPAEYWERVVGPIADLTVIRTSREWLLYDEQSVAIDGQVQLVDPELGVTRQVGGPVNLTKTPARPTARRPLDADRANILAELDRLPAPSPASGVKHVELASALEGLRVIDTTVLLAGPTAGRLLGEYGAEVIHVGNPNWHGMDQFHYQVHTGKKTVLLNLKEEGGLEVFRTLVKDADVLSTNFAQSVGARLGVGEDAVREYNPGIIYSRISAHGVFGPRTDYRGHEEVGQATTGVLHRFGKSAEGNMQFLLLNDDGTGHLAAFGILASLYHRIRTGEGQFVGSSLAQTSATWQTPYMIDHRLRTWDDPGGLDFAGYGALDHRYRGSDGRYFYISVASDVPLSTLASLDGLGGIDLVAPEALQEELERRFATRPAADWVDGLTAVHPRIGARVFSRFDEAGSDAWATEHGLVRQVDFDGQPGRLVGPAPRLSQTPMRMRDMVGPRGSDTREVLVRYGFEDRLEDLIERGIIHDVLPERVSTP